MLMRVEIFVFALGSIMVPSGEPLVSSGVWTQAELSLAVLELKI